MRVSETGPRAVIHAVETLYQAKSWEPICKAGSKVAYFLQSSFFFFFVLSYDMFKELNMDCGDISSEHVLNDIQVASFLPVMGFLFLWCTSPPPLLLVLEHYRVDSLFSLALDHYYYIVYCHLE